MCTILDAAEERGVNRGETLKLIMMVQKKIKKGDSIAKIADDLVEDEIVISCPWFPRSSPEAVQARRQVPRKAISGA